MTDEEQSSASAKTEVSTSNGWRTFGIIVITIIVTLGISYWALTSYLFPTAFTPVELSQKEQTRLDQKLQWVGNNASSNKTTLKPEHTVKRVPVVKYTLVKKSLMHYSLTTLILPVSWLSIFQMTLPVLNYWFISIQTFRFWAATQ